MPFVDGPHLVNIYPAAKYNLSISDHSIPMVLQHCSRLQREHASSVLADRSLGMVIWPTYFLLCEMKRKTTAISANYFVSRCLCKIFSSLYNQSTFFIYLCDLYCCILLSTADTGFEQFKQASCCCPNQALDLHFVRTCIWLKDSNSVISMFVSLMHVAKHSFAERSIVTARVVRRYVRT